MCNLYGTVDRQTLRSQFSADAGDARAACRLGTDLLRCRFVAGWSDEQIEQMASRESELAAKGNLDQANSIAMTLLRHAELQRLCAGLDETLLARGGQYLRQAALAGEPDAVVRYAAGGAFRATGSNSFIATPEFDQWRREAPGLLQEALAAGDPGAALVMLRTHGDNAGFLSMLLPADPLAAQTSLALARRVFGDQLALLALEGRVVGEVDAGLDSHGPRAEIRGDLGHRGGGVRPHARRAFQEGELQRRVEDARDHGARVKVGDGRRVERGLGDGEGVAQRLRRRRGRRTRRSTRACSTGRRSICGAWTMALRPLQVFSKPSS